MTAQEIYTKVRKHLLTQMAKSQLACGNICLYRSSNGLSCAVGCLLDDELAARLDNISMEGIGDIATNSALLPDELARHIDLLTELQTVHDHWSPAVWEERLNLLASSLGLEPV